MKQCPQCQAQVDSNAIFCPNCRYSAPPQTQPPPVVPVKKNKLFLPLAIAGGVVGLCVVLGIVVGIGILMNANKANRSTVATISPTSTTTTSNPTTSISPMRWSEYDNVYNSRSSSTDMQKDALWKNFEGKTVAWQGTVEDVREGTFGGLVLNIKMNSETLTNDIALTLKESEKSEAMSLTKGKKISFVGKLKSYGGAFLPLSMDEGEIK
jgi:hypothetical protein